MRLRFFGHRAITLDATSETIPEKVTVAEVLALNRKHWAQFEQVAPAVANKLEENVLRAANAANRRFWEGPQSLSRSALVAPSYGIKGSEELLAERPAHVKFLTPTNPPDPRVEGLTSEMLALRAMNKRNHDFWAPSLKVTT